MDAASPAAPSSAAREKLIKAHMHHQQEARSRLRHQKLKITFFGYIVVLLFFAFLQIIAVLFFTQGFLLSRDVAPVVADCADPLDTCLDRPVVDKTIMIIIDALRFDFAVPVAGSDKYYHNNFPVLYDTAQREPRRAALLKFVADPPTTTLQRLKGLTTGSLPTFIDAGSNFDGDSIDEDNWLLQLHRQNKSIAFMGDDTWTALFDAYINPDLNFPYPSLNVWDIHTVDNGVLEHLYPLLAPENTTKWDLLVGHFLGVDHIGHRYGPNHRSMKEKLNQMNREITKIMDLMDDKTLLVVMGDHGMDSTGNHGGDSPDELHSTLFAYSKSKRFSINSKPPGVYNVSDAGKHYRSVNQVDLVPTISLLMGLPIPHNNLGFPIDEMFGNDKALLTASYKTLKQLNNFRQSSSALSSNTEINDKFSAFIAEYSKSATNVQKLIEDAKAYQYASLEHCKTLWARFDLPFIIIGVGLLLFSFSFVLTYSRSIPPVRVSTMSFEFIGSVIAMSLLGIVLSASVYIILAPENFTFKSSLSFGVAIGMVIGFWAPIMDRFSIDWLIHAIIDFFIYNFNGWSFLGLLFIVFHCLIFASNSYIIWEDKMVSFFILTFGVCSFVYLAVNTKLESAKRIIGLTHSLTFLVVSRLISMVNLCREEQGGLCRPTFFTTWWSVGLLHLMAFFLPLVIKSFYNLSSSYHSAGQLWIGTGMKFLLFMNAFYWTFEYMENNNILDSTNSFLTANLLKSFKLAIARIVLAISLVLANYSWSRGPLCVKIDFNTPPDEQLSPSPERSPDPECISAGAPESAFDNEDEDDDFKPTATILGYGNIYGSSYFLLVINFTVAVMLVSKPLGALVISGLIVQILSLLELFDILDIRKNLICPILFGLLGYQSFFSTGHQATIPSIQWDVGFMTTESITFPFTHLNILLNTFGPFILVCLAMPLVILWRIPPTSKPVTTLSQVITVVTSLIAYQTLVSLSSFIFTAHFRRHLMVWKIFAPRFMLNGLLLILVNVVLIFITLWFGTSKVLTQVNRIFGK